MDGPASRTDSAPPARAWTGPAVAAVRAFLSDRTTWSILGLFLASRLALLAVGLLADIYLLPGSTGGNWLNLAQHPALRLWGAWDTGWYVSLADGGYNLKPFPDGTANWVFFPAFPTLSTGLAKLLHLPVYPAMLIVSNLSFLAALFLAHRETEAAFDRPSADAVVALLCVVPGSYIYSSAYTESLFLLGLAGCLVFLRQGRWLVAGAFAALAALTRNLGIGLELPMALAAAPLVWRTLQGLAGRARIDPAERAQAARALAALILPVLALASFALYLDLRTGDPLAFVSVQKAWGRSIGNPLAPLMALLHPRLLPEQNLVSFAFCLVSLGLLAVLAAARRWSLFLLGGFLALVPLATGLMSYHRYTLVMLPLFMAAGHLVGRRPGALTATVAALATLSGFMMAAWTLALPVTA